MSSYGSRIDAEKARATVNRILEIKPPGGRLEAAGSLRRGRPTVGDVDLVIDGTDVFWVERLLAEIAHLAGEENCHRTKKDNTLKRVTLDGVPVELYVSKPNRFGAMCLFCTGSMTFNCRQRAVATSKGMLLNQYGLFWSTIDGKGKRAPGEFIAGVTEEEIFQALEMRYVPPCARE